MNTYTQTVPYFYIIRNKKTGMMYAGSRWSKGCHPNEFMVNYGYKTSSLEILNIIEKFGIGIFEILRIDTFCDDLHVYDYETLFLECNDCAGSENWYNKHNNKKISFGTESFKNIMIEVYGMEHFSQVPELKEKMRKTFLKRYGYEYPLQVPEIKEKVQQTKLKRYGNENYNNIEKYFQTNLEKYGVDVYFKTEKFKNLSKETCLNKYGVEFTSQIPEAKNKRNETVLNRYGVEHPSKRMKVCCFCNEFKNINHEKRCKLNPNRNIALPNNKKGNNPSAKKVILNGIKFNSITEASSYINVQPSKISYVLNSNSSKTKFPEGVWELKYAE